MTPQEEAAQAQRTGQPIYHYVVDIVWQYVCDKILLHVPLPITNKSKSQEWVLDDDVKQLIKTYYKEDIKYYNSL